jgi:small-conductance mechanosensitive channel
MSFIQENLPIVLAAAVILLSLVLGYAVRRVFLGRLSRLADATSSKVDDAIVDSLRRPLPNWFVLGGLYFAQRLAQMPPEIGSIVEKGIVAIFIVSVTFWAANLSAHLLQLGITAPGMPVPPATGVVRYVTKILVLAVGALVLLSTLGISVTPILTTVGIGGLAVALGLQETLSNLFAGIHVTLAGDIRVGDFIKLETGEEGYVEDIRWRVTRVRTLPNNTVLIPNSRLAQSVVTNYHTPSKETAVQVDVGVSYGSDLEKVERITVEAARAIQKTVPGAVPEFDPFIRYNAFGENSIRFSVILRAKEFTDGFLLKHELVKALAKAYAAEDIVIPVSLRAINLIPEGAFTPPSTPPPGPR